MKFLRLSLFWLLCIVPMISFASNDNLLEPYKKHYMITGYYSPLPDQEHYSTGAYHSDITLNGRGTNGASGREVFPGMLAAPKSYPFGFKIFIPGIGLAEVQDRGGAIVASGQQGNEYDRLDIWMGSGDAGLRRALLWGKRLVEATVYGVRTDMQVDVEFEGWSDNELALVEYWKQFAPSATNSSAATLFKRDLWVGDTSDEVKSMQELLVTLGYLKDANGTYDETTRMAVFHFQRDNDIVYDLEELGAGHFGPQTRVIIESAKEKFEKGEYKNQTLELTSIATYEDLSEDFYVYDGDLSLGSTGDDVVKLQEELVKLGFLRLTPTGSYGDVTRNAVMRYQLKQGIISSKTDSGAGVVGPSTRASLNALFDDRITTKAMIANKRMTDDMTEGDFVLASAQ